MIYADGKELYYDFLLSDFWIELSRLKRKLVSKCERCGSDNRLQAHHLRYPDNWFDTKLSDLKVLCRECHEKEHGISTENQPEPKVSESEKEQLWRLYNNNPKTIFPKKKNHKKHKKHHRRFHRNKSRAVRAGNFLVRIDGKLVYEPRF